MKKRNRTNACQRRRRREARSPVENMIFMYLTEWFCVTSLQELSGRQEGGPSSDGVIKEKSFTLGGDSSTLISWDPIDAGRFAVLSPDNTNMLAFIFFIHKKQPKRC